MLNVSALKRKLESIDGEDYGAYQSLAGEYGYPGFKLIIEQIPKDPYAPPHTGIYRIQVRRRDDDVIRLSSSSKTGAIAFRDFWRGVFTPPARR